jgi:hypothetical protein
LCSFISNTSIVSINFRANLDAQNAGNCISGPQISNIFWGSMHPDPHIHAWYVGHTHGLPSMLLYPLVYYLAEKSLFKKMPPPPHGKILKKGRAIHAGKDENWAHVREVSHIDFVHEKRHMFVSLETPHPLLETSHIVIDILFLQHT